MSVTKKCEQADTTKTELPVSASPRSDLIHGCYGAASVCNPGNRFCQECPSLVGCRAESIKVLTELAEEGLDEKRVASARKRLEAQ